MPFLASDFKTPSAVQTKTFLLRPITIHDVIKDYDAVMSSHEHLWDRFGEKWGWPPPDLSIEQDLIDLAWHQKEAQIHSSFNFAVMSPDQTRLLGCVYIDPPAVEDIDAEVWFWVRQSELSSGLESKLKKFVFKWLKDSWPFVVVSLNDKVITLEQEADA
ncbi:GNAT family N-acetyltransferase [bacterium]|nr:GNAT family N-acetyltransferase [bacterium]